MFGSVFGAPRDHVDMLVDVVHEVLSPLFLCVTISLTTGAHIEVKLNQLARVSTQP